MKTIFLVFALSLIGCCQTIPLYTELSWDYSYQDETGQPIDSSQIEFVIFKNAGVSFVEYARTQDTNYWLLQNRNLYNGLTHYFYVESYWIPYHKYSVPGDTVSALFREIQQDKVYNTKILSVPLKQ